jgi:hypothetical protein
LRLHLVQAAGSQNLFFYYFSSAGMQKGHALRLPIQLKGLPGAGQAA